jgi:hypothetical protein
MIRIKNPNGLIFNIPISVVDYYLAQGWTIVKED